MQEEHRWAQLRCFPPRVTEASRAPAHSVARRCTWSSMADREGWGAQARKPSLNAPLRALRVLGIHPNESGSGLLLRIDAARYVGGIVGHESDECPPPRVLP